MPRQLLATLLLLGLAPLSQAAETATATFAGGCFWCMEKPFDELDGVISTVSGYTDGETKSPTYKQVSSGRTGHTEGIQITYDPSKVSYEKLLEVFWVNVDPTDVKGQFCDRGSQYRPGIYYHDAEQKAAAKASLEKVKQTKTFKEDILLEIKPASTYYPAEDYHQDYYLKNPLRYKYYRFSCGRDNRLQELWGDKAS